MHFECGIVVENFVIWDRKHHLFLRYITILYTTKKGRKRVSKGLIVFISYLLKELISYLLKEFHTY